MACCTASRCAHPMPMPRSRASRPVRRWPFPALSRFIPMPMSPITARSPAWCLSPRRCKRRASCLRMIACALSVMPWRSSSPKHAKRRGPAPKRSRLITPNCRSSPRSMRRWPKMPRKSGPKPGRTACLIGRLVMAMLLRRRWRDQHMSLPCASCRTASPQPAWKYAPRWANMMRKPACSPCPPAARASPGCAPCWPGRS